MASLPLDQVRSGSSIDFSSSLRPKFVRSPPSVQPPPNFLRDQDGEVDSASSPCSRNSSTQTHTPSHTPHQRPSIVPKPHVHPEAGPQTIQVVNKRSPFGAILSRTLPSYTGTHPVGVRDVEVPITKQRFGYFEHKSMPSRGAGLTVDTVFFTLFYPAEKRETNSRVVWFPR